MVVTLVFQFQFMWMGLKDSDVVFPKTCFHMAAARSKESFEVGMGQL